MSDMHHNGNRGNGHGRHGHSTETPDVSHIRNVEVTHEMSDVSVEGILKFLIGLSIMTMVTLGLMWMLFNLLNRRQEKKETPPGPMAMTEQERLPPEPRLQASRGFGVKLENGQDVNLESTKVPAQPQAEYRALRQQWTSTLEAGKTDSTGKATAIPIAEAMKQLLENKGLATSPQDKNGSENDAGIKAPTSASSGRVTEKRW